MPGWIKVLLVLLLVFVVGGGVAAYVWVQNVGDVMDQEREQMSRDARQFAQGKEQADCLRETLRRATECGDLSPLCQVKVQVFFKLCFDQTAPSPGLCDGVPSSSDVLKSVKFITARCGRLGRVDDKSCHRVFSGLQKRCDGSATTGPSRARQRRKPARRTERAPAPASVPTVRREATKQGVTVGTPTVKGGVSPAEVQRVFRRNLGRLEDCYRRRLTVNPKLSGQAALSFEIYPDGKTRSLTVSGSMNDADLESCLTRQMRNIRFPKPRRGGPAKVTCPLVFTPG